MDSVLKIYGTDTIGVLMTGIGDDGADQMVAIRQAGGHTIAESQQTAVVWGMPREAIERGGACVVAAARREPAQVAADGVHSVRELIDLANADPRRGEHHATVLSTIKLDTVSLAVLAEQGLTPGSVPPGISRAVPGAPPAARKESN